MTMHWLARYFWHLASFVMVGLASTASGQPFVSPIGGMPYVDWTIVNYSDLDSTEGIVDYRGGNYTYNGHNAIDYILANFAAMDAGVPVYAAADGTVLFAHDGEHDRCSRVSPCGDFPNYIWIQHANGVITDYLHLKKGSINVSVGQQVVAGQQIALVGSSGLSSDAHLHFTVRQNGAFVETYQDPARWWINPVPYADDVAGSLDHGITNHYPSTTELVDRPLDHPVFQQADGISVSRQCCGPICTVSMPETTSTSITTGPMGPNMHTSTTKRHKSVTIGGSRQSICPRCPI
jgi:murein DD-endopeptidase MepM/ murein hydrolase activator NlpD